jgi:hypothetical protein
MSGSAYHVSESNSSLRLLDSHSGSIEEAHEYAATHWFSGRRPLDTGSNSRRTEEHEKPLSVQRVSSFRCVCGGGGARLVHHRGGCCCGSACCSCCAASRGVRGVRGVRALLLIFLLIFLAVFFVVFFLVLKHRPSPRKIKPLLRRIKHAVLLRTPGGRQSLCT